jgi:hypothetical protein
LRTGKQNWRNAYNKKIQSALQAAARWQRDSGVTHNERETELLAELRGLKQRIADLERQRDAALQAPASLRRCDSNLPPAAVPGKAPRAATSRARLRPLHLKVTATSMLLVLAALASATTLFDDGRDPALTPAAGELLANAAPPSRTADTQPAAAHGTAEKGSPALRASARKKLARRAGPTPAHRQWGPPLLLPDLQPPGRLIRAAGLGTSVKQLQRDLLDLGFDLGQSSADGLWGPRSAQALQEFRSLFIPDTESGQTLTSGDLAFLVNVYADLARRDAESFNIDRGVVAAIRLSSVRTGVEFSFLMELAAVESAFNPLARAPGSSASGLYQFTRETWLNTVKAHGDKYGMAPYVEQIQYIVDRRGNRRPRIADKDLYQHLLDLRDNPRVAAMMAAESVKDNLTKLSYHFDHQPGRTDLYLTHFLGPDGAVSFLRALNETPENFAADLFPSAAATNQSIFHPSTCEPRTVNEVYEIFSRKFNTSRYENLALN